MQRVWAEDELVQARPQRTDMLRTMRGDNGEKTMNDLVPDYSLHNPMAEIYVGDCCEWLNDYLFSRGDKSSFADLVFADPPFNIMQKYAGYEDGKPTPDYELFMYRWLQLCACSLTPTGSMWVNIPDQLAAETVVYLKGQELKLINWCINSQRFGQWRRGNFIVSKTHLLYFARDKATRTWNPDAILVPSLRASKYNDKRTLKTKRPGKRVPLDVWDFPRVQGNNKERWPGHPNQIPEQLLKRIILACSNEGDLVLDPFLGSGTTSVVARALGRRSIGIEISAASAESAFERIKKGWSRWPPAHSHHN